MAYEINGTVAADLAAVRSALGIGLNPNRFALLGDSRLAKQYTDVTTTRRQKAANCFFNVANTLLGQRMLTAANLSVAGYRTDQLVPFITSALNNDAMWIILWSGVNSITQGYTAAAIFADIKIMADAAIAAGKRPIICTEPGDGAYATTVLAGKVYDLNEMLREYCEKSAGAVLFDIANLQIDPASASYTVAKSGYTQDNVHLNVLGSYIVGQAFATLIDQLGVPPLPFLPVASAEKINTGSANLLSNPFFTTTTGGTNFNTGSISGNIPASWIVNASGSVSCVFSSAANADGYGNDVIATLTTMGFGQVSLYQQINTPGFVTPGVTQLYSGAEVTIDAGSSNFPGVAANCNITVDGVGATYWDNFPPNTEGPGVTTAHTQTLKTDPNQAAAGSVITSASAGLIMYGIGTGSAVVRIRRPFWRKRLT